MLTIERRVKAAFAQGLGLGCPDRFRLYADRPAVARRARLRPAWPLAAPGALLRGQRGQCHGLARGRLDGLRARARVGVHRRVRACSFGPRLDERNGARARLVWRAAGHARPREVVARLFPPRRQDDLGWLGTPHHAPHRPPEPRAKSREPARPVSRGRSSVNHGPHQGVGVCDQPTSPSAQRPRNTALSYTGPKKPMVVNVVVSRLRPDPPEPPVSPDSRSNEWSRRWDSNPRPSVYETDALPLSYFGARERRF